MKLLVHRFHVVVTFYLYSRHLSWDVIQAVMSINRSLCLLKFRLFSRCTIQLLVITVWIMSAGRMSAQSRPTLKEPQKGQDASQVQARKKLSSIPLGLEPNRGQWDASVEYAAKASQYTLFLTSSEALFVLPEHIEIPSSVKSIAAQTAAQRTPKPSTWTSVAMRFDGARSLAEFSTGDQLPGNKNYYLGRDKTKWVTGVPLYSGVVAHDVYPGIDVAFRGVARELEFDFLVNPGANPKRIKLTFVGEKRTQIDASGDLVLSSVAGDLRLHRPLAYQQTLDGKRELVEARFERRRNGEIGLALGHYDRGRQLIIDPSVTYATYLGGTGLDEGLGIAVD